MKIKIWMIRHGMTAGNRQQRYVGTTDELLCEEGRQQIILKRQLIKSYQNIQNVYVSPMLRCRETAEILFPAVSQITEAGFRECSFGEFEYRNYQELNGHPDYQAWIDSGGTIGFPGGEDQKAFCDRVQTAFEACIRDDVMPKARNWGQTYAGQNAAEKEFTTAMVVHGGTIMAILSKWALPHQDYFYWQVKNGCGYLVCLDTDEWLAEKGSLSVIEKF